MFGVGLGSAIISNAQDRYPNGDSNRHDRNFDQYGNYRGSVELRHTALRAGYDQGARRGDYDRGNSKQSSYRNAVVYRKATQDYNSRLGDRELYRRYFREAFENGYNADSNGPGARIGDNRYPNRDNNATRTRHGRNWDGYGNFGGSPELRQTALN